MPYISSQGARLYVQDLGTMPAQAIAAASNAAPCVLTMAGVPVVAFGDVVIARNTGWSIDGQSFHVMGVDPDAHTVTLEDSDTRNEGSPLAPGATLEKATMLELCRTTITLTMPERPSIETTTIIDRAARLLTGPPAISTWQAGGFYDASDDGAAALRAHRRSGALVAFRVDFNDGSGVCWTGNVNAEDLSIAINAAIGNSAGGAIDGLLAFFTSPAVVVELRSFLGYQNVFVNGVPWSFSEQGDFTFAEWVGDRVKVRGPNPERPDGFLIKRAWNIRGRLGIIGNDGQSNAGGTNSNLAGVSSASAARAQTSPMPGKLVVVAGGKEPTQSGIAASGVNDLINPINYQGPLRDGHENINDHRTPGAELNADVWSMSFAMTIANAVDGSNKILPIGVPHGSTNFSQDVRRVALLAGASWLAGIVTFLFTADTQLGPNQWFRVKSVTPNGYNRTYKTLTVSPDGLTVTAALAGNPGVYVPGNGFAYVASPPWINLRNMVTYHATVTAPALGLTPYFIALIFNGNEADDVLSSVTGFLQEYMPDLRALVDELEAICGQTERAWIMWAQVGYPVSGWQSPQSVRFDCASNITLGVLAAARDPANFVLTGAQWPGEAGGDGDANVGGSIHWGWHSHQNNGERPANALLDALINGAPQLPLIVEEGEDVLVRVANSKTITGRFNRLAVVNTDPLISDPGNDGFQAFAGIATGQVGELIGGRGKEWGVASVTIDGATFTAELTAVPPPDGNYWGTAYMNATRYVAANNTIIDGYTWAAGKISYHTIEPHGIAVDGEAVVANMDPAAANVIPAVAALAGTAGQTLVLPMAVDPGLAPLNGGTWLAGKATFTTPLFRGRTAGNWVTTAGNDPATWDGTFQIVNETPDHLGFVVAMAVDPGPLVTPGGFKGAGSLALNGEYGIGRKRGLRARVFEPVVDWWSIITGEPLQRPHAHQLAHIDVYASTGHLWDALVELGLDGFFELVIDMGDPACWDGSSNVVHNRGTAAGDFYLGLGPSDTTALPTFVGVPGAFDRSNFMTAATSGKTFTPVTASTLFANSHKKGNGYTMFGGLRVNAALTANNYQLANCLTEGTGQGPGIFFRVGNSRRWSSGVRGDAGASVFSISSGPAWELGAYGAFGLGVHDLDPQSWSVDDLTGWFQFTPVYSAPSIAPAQSAACIWRNGAGGTHFAQAGMDSFFLLAAGSKLSREKAAPLWRTIKRRQMQGLG